MGDTRALTATSDAALPVTGLTWVSSDASVVTVDPANDGTIVAEGLGQATITATLDGLTATTTVRVLPGGIAPGQTIWTAAPTPGRYVHATMRANPALDEDPDLFSVEVNGVTSAMVVKAVRGADGVTLWSHAVPERPQASDAFGGFLYIEHEPGQPFSSSALRRVGGGGVAPWTYHSRSGYIGSAAAAPDGTVYLTEYRYSPSSQLPTNNNPEPARVDTYIVGLDGRTGAVRFQRSLPNGTARYPDEADGGVCVSPRHTDGGLLGPITVLENGDAAVQHEVQHFDVGGSCQTPGPMYRQTTLSAWRVSPEGAITSTTLRQYSGTCPDGFVGVGNEYFTPSVNRPDGHGGMLATWQHSVADPVSGGQYGNVSRILDGAVVFTQPAPWAQHYDDRERSDVMIASGGTAYLSDGLNGELVARQTETWALKWASQTHGEAIEALADGNLLRTSATANGAGIETVDASGATLGSTSASVSGFLNALPDQDVIFGVEEVTGALAQISAERSRGCLNEIVAQS